MYQLFLLVAIVLLGSAAYAGLKGAPWVPTWKRDLKRIERLLDLKPGERFVELGCGNARVCRHLQQAQPGATIEGVELSIVQFVVGWIQNRLSKSPARTKFGNVFSRDLRGYDALYMFLMPATYSKIRPKLESELKPGARVVTYAWPIQGWKPLKIDEADGSQKIFLYQR
jgi:SAM-dependent methyltransferase